MKDINEEVEYRNIIFQDYRLQFSIESESQSIHNQYFKISILDHQSAILESIDSLEVDI